MSDLETSGPEDHTAPNRWTLRSGEEWQELTGEAVALLVRNVLGQNMLMALTLAEAKELHEQLGQHITSATPKPVPKTREEMAAFATAWDAKVDASRARQASRG